MTAPDYADRIAAQVAPLVEAPMGWFALAKQHPELVDMTHTMLLGAASTGAREGYELGLGVSS